MPVRDIRSQRRKRVMQAVKDEGLSMPRSLGPIEEDEAFPLDITELTLVQVRRLLSFWTAHLGYVHVYVAKSAIDAMSFKAQVRQFERNFKATSQHKQQWRAEAELAENKHYRELVDHHEMAEAKLIMAKALQDAFEGYYAAASRELTARMSEGERDMSGRSGP